MPTTVSVKEYSERFAYNSSNLIEYQGWSFPGASTAEPVWAIVKFTYDGTSVIKKEFADGNKKEDNVWDDRESLSYS